MAARERVFGAIGKSVKAVAKSRGSEWWYTPDMAAAARAIEERIPLVDLILEVRDARIPLSSEYLQLRKIPSACRIIVLNKADLADCSQTKFLTFLQARVRELKKKDDRMHLITLMLVGILNVRKSALANSLHQVGRIYAAEKGRLKHSVVTPQPGETKSICSLKIASHPNIFVLDTPSVLPPDVIDDEVCSKLVVTGAIKDSVAGEINLAEYFLSILNLGEEYKKWAKLSSSEAGVALTGDGSLSLGKKQKKLYPTDHTQDFIVNNVRRTLFDSVSSFGGCTEDGEDLARLIQGEFEVLQKVFHLPLEIKECNYSRVAIKLLTLYRIGRLGH
ncbi:DAR GTPase 2, mitochondrial-like [Salvia miltiorrhiza]|uniref:DAR GTPase 2, mitochondrial-like n=1 Tax=Salvia miltiorrhiza TaxID=226208 RepID=UPI0025AD2E76|nr:DAR GTPase 2, mitochondrial-like [Salvia miltiorrhiza]